MNRFYRPSAPRYTSQFVEDQYPMDMILQAGAMKYQNKQKMAGDIAEFSAMANVLPAGNRTQEMAPIVRQNWDKRINDTITKYSSSYDSPQAMMEFTKLKQEWQRDPDVQLMKYDYEVGNKEWEEIRKSPTYAMDKKGENINPQTGMLKQFRPGDSYKPYAPVTKYAAWDEKAMNEYKTIELQSKYVKQRKPYKDELGNVGMEEVQGEVQYRDPKMIQEKTLSMAQNVINRSTPEGSYVFEDLKEKLGRIPTVADAVQYYKPIESSAVAYKENFQTNWNENTGGGSGSGTGITGMNNGQGVTFRTPISVKTEGTARVGVSDIRQINTDKIFGNTREMNAYEKALQKRVLASNPTLDKEGQLKEMKRIIKEERDRPYSLKYNYWGPEVEKEVNTVFGGGINEKGELTAEGSKAMFEGSTLIDLTTGEYVQDMDDKDALTAKDNILRVLGTADRNDKAMQPMPGSIFIESVNGGKSKMYLVKSEDLAQKEKPMWNFNGYQRDALTGIGDVFAIDFYSDGTNHQEQYYDMSDPNTNNDQKNIQAQTGNGLYFVPQRDFSSGEIKVKVFAANPTGSDIEDTEKNPLYLKEYKASDYNGSMQRLKDKILEDVYTSKGDNNLLKYRNKVMSERFPNK